MRTTCSVHVVIAVFSGFCLVACKPGGGGGGSSSSGGASSSSSSGGGSSSGGSSGGASSGGSVALEQLCAAWEDAFCQTPPCDTGAGYDDAKCRAQLTGTGCGVASLQAEIAAGRLRYDPEAAARCVSFYRSYLAGYDDALCDPDPVAQLTYYFETVTFSCVNNAPHVEGWFTGCDTMFVGLVARGGSCADDEACAPTAPAVMGACENVPDGGCGTCGDSVAQVGQRCRWSADGGTPRSIACAEGHQCDDSDTCVPYRAAGGSCGTGVGACEPACGLSCKETDAGSACLTTAHVNAGAPCSYFAEPTIYCGAGLACVLRGTDAGYPDFQAPGTCRAQAIAGQQCSAGFNYDVYSGWGPAFSGAMAYGTSPACALGLGCDRGADAGWWDPGTCRAYTRTTLGQPCGDVVTCPPTAYCGTLTDGGPKVCVAKPSTGGDCSRDSDCAAASRCADASDGGRCTPRKADGQPCTADSDCAHYSVCFHHVCTPGQNAVEDPVTCR